MSELEKTLKAWKLPIATKNLIVNEDMRNFLELIANYRGLEESATDLELPEVMAKVIDQIIKNVTKLELQQENIPVGKIEYSHPLTTEQREIFAEIWSFAGYLEALAGRIHQYEIFDDREKTIMGYMIRKLERQYKRLEESMERCEKENSNAE